MTESFPTPEHPGRGVFICEQVLALARMHEMTVLFPRPVLPGIPSSALEARARTLDRSHPGSARAPEPAPPVRVLRPGYFYIPRHRGLRTRQLASLVRRTLLTASEPFDVVHAHWLAPAGWAAILGAAGLGVPVVVTAHAGDVYRDLRYAGRMRVAQVVVRRATRLIAVADYFREPLLRAGATPGKLRVIHNGVDLGVFAPAEREQARLDLQLPAGVPIYLYIGNLEEAKGAADVVEAFFAWAPAEAILVVAGNGRLWASFARRAAGSNGRMILRGWQAHDAVARYLVAATCFVLPSYAEGNPVTVLESLCCGTPVIGSAIPAIGSLIDEGKNGLLVPPGDVRELGSALCTVLTRTWNPAMIAQRAAARYGWQAIASDISETYEEALAETDAARVPSPAPGSHALMPPR
ncbi:MAG: glycosyltransferase [Gammaproteobacteria bacterium]